MFRFLLQFLKAGYCHVRPDFTQTMYISRESMHETFVVFMYNKRINGELRRFYDYRLRTVHEFGILELMITSLLEAVVAELAPQFEKTYQVMKCIDNVVDKPDKSLPHFMLSEMRKSMLCCAVGLLFAITSLSG